MMMMTLIISYVIDIFIYLNNILGITVTKPVIRILQTVKWYDVLQENTLK